MDGGGSSSGPIHLEVRAPRRRGNDRSFVEKSRRGRRRPDGKRRAERERRRGAVARGRDEGEREAEKGGGGGTERGNDRDGGERSKEVNCPEIFNPVERPRDPLLARRVSNGQDKFPIGSMANRVKRFSRLVILCFHPRSTDVPIPILLSVVSFSLSPSFLSFPFLSYRFYTSGLVSLSRPLSIARLSRRQLALALLQISNLG